MQYQYLLTSGEQPRGYSALVLGAGPVFLPPADIGQKDLVGLVSEIVDYEACLFPEVGLDNGGSFNVQTRGKGNRRGLNFEGDVSVREILTHLEKNDYKIPKGFWKTHRHALQELVALRLS